tara:strand:- start:1689 stop:2519 length:831 start_codon:yes stop_codon:yes gene_type:complete
VTLSISDYVNEAPSSNSLGQIHSFLVEIDLPCPIDAYIDYSRSLISYGTPEKLSENQHLGGLLLLGAVSAAEAYFRSIFSLTLEMCPISRECAAEKQINLGGVLWHGHAEFRRSAFEHLSFCSKDDIKKAAKAYLKFDLKDSSFKGPLEQFDIVCHLRHGIVHNAGILPGRNAVQIGAKSYKKPVRISVDFATLQRSIEAIDTLVLTFNREIFNEMCHRWAVGWRKRSDWDPTVEDKVFNNVWKTYFCRKLHFSRQGKSAISRAKCLSEIRNKYEL